MSLWVDKHRPKRLAKLDYHQVNTYGRQMEVEVIQHIKEGLYDFVPVSLVATV